MNALYPHIRLRAQHGGILIRDGLSVCLYMRRSHEEIAPAVMRSLERYQHAVGRDALRWYCDYEGDWQELDAKGWEVNRREFLDGRASRMLLTDQSDSMGEYEFEYRGRWLEQPDAGDQSRLVSTVCFWLSTEFLEKHGPSRVRELAMELAVLLPFNSGHAGLSFHADMDLLGVGDRVRRMCFRYPGMDVPNPYASMDIGTQVRGVHWLNFLGQPVLGELGGAAGLRSRLSSPGTTVQEMEGARAVVTLGLWPEAGDTEQGRDLPAYRELARVLEPWLFVHDSTDMAFRPGDTRRWDRRFLD